MDHWFVKPLDYNVNTKNDVAVIMLEYLGIISDDKVARKTVILRIFKLRRTNSV